MDKIKHYYFWECWGCWQALVGMILFFASMLFANAVSLTVFVTSWVLGLLAIMSGIVIAGTNGPKRHELNRLNFFNSHVHCPNCEGTGWIKKEK